MEAESLITVFNLSECYKRSIKKNGKTNRVSLKRTRQFGGFEIVAEAHGQGRSADGNLQRRDVVGGHVVLAAALIFVVDDVLAHVVVGTGVAHGRLAPPAVHHVDQHHDCRKEAPLKKNRRKSLR